MNAALVTLVCFALFGLAYATYGRFLASRIFQLDPTRRTPAHEKEDGVDYVPTKVPVLFGHHFASIAGMGPILGPAVAVIWGWLPAVLWVVLGSIFMGAVHDLGALTVSLRYRGRSVGDVGQDLMGPRARLLFLLVIFFLMSLAMGAFVNAIAGLFLSFNPDAVVPSFGLILVAMVVGLAVYRFRVGLGLATVVGLAAFAGLLLLGVARPVPLYDRFLDAETQAKFLEGQIAEQSPRIESPYGSTAAIGYFKAHGDDDAAAQVLVAVGHAKFTWIMILLGYGFLASVLPVWLLLQPRDYINSFQLYLALAALLIGLSIASFTGQAAGVIHAPAVRTAADFAADAAPPSMFPFLFVTIACGAVSGFHSLVSSGTTVRQLNREGDALPIGYGAMLTEGALAVLVIMACVAGLGAAGWTDNGPYSSWRSISGGGLAVQLDAVITGGANYMRMLGVPIPYGRAFLAVTIVAFAMTTLDSATRLLRFNVEEIFHSLRLAPLANRYVASFVAVCGIAMFGLSESGKALWILFGTGNQLLAGLTLLTVSLFLYKLGRPMLYTLVPMFFMLAVTLVAMSMQAKGYWDEASNMPANDPQWFQKWFLFGVAVTIIVLTLWLIVEGALSFRRGRGGLHFEDLPPESEAQKAAERVEAMTHLG